MKLVIKLFVSAFLLLGITACSQESVTNTASKTNDSAQSSSGTSNGSNPSDAQGSICTTAPSSSNNKDRVPVTVTKTVDGDTIKVVYGEKEVTVRYLLVDTPEDKKPGVCIQPFALDAANRNKQLVNSGAVTLEFEQSQNQTDKYGRLLAYVFVNGVSVQETLLNEGYARVAYVYEPHYKYLIPFVSAETKAKSQKLKIWSKPGYVTDTGFQGCDDTSADSTNQ